MENDQREGDGNDARRNVVRIERLRSQRTTELEDDEDGERKGAPDVEQIGRHPRVPGFRPDEDGERKTEPDHKIRGPPKHEPDQAHVRCVRTNDFLDERQQEGR